MRYLALCCIARDEDPFLKEWLAYHALMGVEHFYIYDHCSKNPIRQALGSFADDSRVTVRRVAGEKMQIPAYDDCLRSFGGDCRWIGFLDLDEFVLPMRDNDLRVLLSEFESYGGLAATWHLFGSSGHLRRPEGPVIKNYLQAFAVQDSYHVKCFVQPARTIQALGPHTFRYGPEHFCVNEDHYPVSPTCPCTFSSGRLVRVHHYFLRSQQDFEEKVRRGRADSDDPAKNHRMDMFYNSIAVPCVEDAAIQRFLPPLEAALREGALPDPIVFPPTCLSYEDFMDAAMKLHEAGQPEKAQALLCQGALEHGEKADLWTLRALIAQAAGRETRADVFIRQALVRECTQTVHAQLLSLLRARGLNSQAEGLEAVLRRYPDFFA